MPISYQDFKQIDRKMRVRDFIKELETDIDVHIAKYANATLKERERMPHTVQNQEVYHDSEEHPEMGNTLGEQMAYFTPEEQDTIRKTVVKDYRDAGWAAYWHKNETMHRDYAELDIFTPNRK